MTYINCVQLALASFHEVLTLPFTQLKASRQFVFTNIYITRSKSVKFYLSAAYHGRFCFGGPWKIVQCLLKTAQSNSVRGILLQSPKINNKKDIVLITPEKKIDDNEIFTDTRKTCFATNAISVFSFC